MTHPGGHSQAILGFGDQRRGAVLIVTKSGFCTKGVNVPAQGNYSSAEAGSVVRIAAPERPYRPRKSSANPLDHAPACGARCRFPLAPAIIAMEGPPGVFFLSL